MSETETSSLSPANLLRIILAAMNLGVLLFAGFVVYQRLEMRPLEFGASPLDFVVLVLVPVQLVVSLIVPRQMLRAICRTLANDPATQALTDESLKQRLLQSYLAATIIGSALAEAACFLVLVVLLLGAPSLFWILFGLGLLMLLSRFPLGHSLERQLESLVTFIREQQQFGPLNRHEK